jgi:hypothetical protein
MSAAFGAGYAFAHRSALAKKMNLLTPSLFAFSTTSAPVAPLLEATSSSMHLSSPALTNTTPTDHRQKTANRTTQKEPSSDIQQQLFTDNSSKTKTISTKENETLSSAVSTLPSAAIASNNTTPPTQETLEKQSEQWLTNADVKPLNSLSEKALLIALSTPDAPFASEQPIHHLSTFQIGLSYTTSFMFYPSTAQVQTKGQVGHGVSLFAEKSGQRLHWGAGIQWQQMAYHFLYRNTSPGTYTYNGVLLEVLRDENMTIIEEIYGDTTVSSLEQTEISFNNRYTHVGGTIYFRYSPFRNFPRTTVGLGLTGFKVLEQRGRYVDANNDYTAPITTPNGGLRSWGIMPNFTLEHTLPLSPNWAISSSLRISYLGAPRWAVSTPQGSVVPSLSIGLRRTFVR